MSCHSPEMGSIKLQYCAALKYLILKEEIMSWVWEKSPGREKHVKSVNLRKTVQHLIAWSEHVGWYGSRRCSCWRTLQLRTLQQEPHLAFHSAKRASLATQLVKSLPARRETRVRALRWEYPLGRERIPAPVCWPAEFQGPHSARGCKESEVTEKLSFSVREVVRPPESFSPVPKDVGHESLEEGAFWKIKLLILR